MTNSEQATIEWAGYARPGGFDELVVDGHPRPGAAGLLAYLGRMTLAELRDRQHAAELAIRTMGITFTVYSDGTNIDRAWPFDVIPRVIATDEWSRISAGLAQRVRALNCFIADVYGKQRCLRDGVVPPELVLDSPNFRDACVGARPALDLWAHICGSDLVRGADGVMYVLEDNLRVPSGVSYMLENRLVTKRVFGDLFRDLDILPVDGYPDRLGELLSSLSPRPGDEPTIAVLTPGVFNSAYFEHSFLAQQMGALLVEGADLFVGDDDCVYVRTIDGRRRIDVIYRRVDDLFLDPDVFRADSTLGVPGLLRAWRAGNVGLANAPGAGVADDKAVYAYVPAMIRYYLGEDPLVANVPTYLCSNDAQRSHVLANLAELVVKPTNESGGYGIFVGPHAAEREFDEIRRRIEADPANFVAQPTLDLSTAPTLCEGVVEPRHVDLRPFILAGDPGYVTEGGLTRVALRRGSLVVNSSQGGGSKDTWVIDPSFAIP